MNAAEAEYGSWIAALVPRPAMWFGGAGYLEKPVAHGSCDGCAFQHAGYSVCDAMWKAGAQKDAFGGECTDRDVIYIRAAS